MRLLIASFAAVAFTGTAAAQTLSVNPGQWEYVTDMDMTLTMDGQTIPMPMEQDVSTECLTAEDAVLDPQELAQNGCSISNVQTTATTMSFDMNCSQDGMTMTGDASVVVSNGGNAADLTMNMSGNAPGQGSMSMSVDMKTKRLGACS